MSDRGMKKWAPYKSLIEHDPALDKIKKDREKVSKPKISIEEAEEINEILVHYHGQEVIITYYREGKINELQTTIKKVDDIARRILTVDRNTITFSELIRIQNA